MHMIKTQREQAPRDHERGRRADRRFPVALKLNYRMTSGECGKGEVCNISSGGLMFRSGSVLLVGKMIDVILAWPLLMDGDCPMQLRISGRVVRSDATGTAIAIGKYEFQTADRSESTPGPHALAAMSGRWHLS
jgi:hypothetical protein